MHKKNFLIGMGMGLAVGSCIMCAVRPKRRCMKSTVGKTLRAMGEAVDAACDHLGL